MLRTVQKTDSTVEIALTPERYALIKEIFAKAIQVEEKDRDALLGEACGQDEDLRREIESLLQYHFDIDKPDHFLETSQ